MNTEIGDNGKFVAIEMWGKWVADFLKEDGKWKIWHFVMMGDFACEKDQNWYDNMNKPLPRTIPEEPSCDFEGKVGYHPYTNKTLPQYNPEPPEPYNTWDDSMSYLN